MNKLSTIRIVGVVFALIVALIGFLYWRYPTQVINTVRFFPHYNPFEPAGFQTSNLTDIDSDTSSQIVEFAVATNFRTQRRVFAYLPAGYDPEKEERQYPSLYLLHGTPGSEVDWLEQGGGNAKEILDTLIVHKQIPPVVVIFPKGSDDVWDDNGYINSADNRYLNEDYVVKNLVQYVDSHFNTLKEPGSRAIAGLSLGGYAALNLGLKHQDTFGSAISLSGYGNLYQDEKSRKYIQGSDAVIHDNSPLLYVPELEAKSIKALLITGSNDDFLAENEKLYGLLREHGIDAVLEIHEGDHNWEFWREYLDDGLRWWAGSKV